jgi:magnesium transporter
MTLFFKRSSKKVGLPPGTLVHIGEEQTHRVKITVIDYDEGQFQEKETKAVQECLPFKDKPTVTWINIDGVHQLEIIEKVGKHFHLHPLILEDIMNTEQRPKMEDFGDHPFVMLKMLYHDEKDDAIKAEHVSLILGSNFVISFQEREGDVFSPVRERIRNAKGRIRKMGSDYLFYALADAIVDHYFIILERLGEKIESLEEEVTGEPTPTTSQAVHTLKREMLALRKSIWPLREVVGGLVRGESSLIQESTGIYLRNVYDHTIQIIDTIDTFRDMLSGMTEIYLSTISTNMNKVMKVLTIIATVFIPLTFIAGIYGMNFKFMPELEWQYGYPVILVSMIGMGIAMVIYFRIKRWL